MFSSVTGVSDAGAAQHFLTLLFEIVFSLTKIMFFVSLLYWKAFKHSKCTYFEKRKSKFGEKLLINWQNSELQFFDHFCFDDFSAKAKPTERLKQPKKRRIFASSLVVSALNVVTSYRGGTVHLTYPLT